MIDDLSAFIIAGRVKAKPAGQFETDERSPAQGIEDGVEAERIGFHRIFVSERWNLKEAGVLLAGVGALTENIGLGTGLVNPASRHPLHMAALGSTITAAFGNRFVLGLGRGDAGVLKGTGLAVSSFEAFVDYVGILKRLWAGDTVSYDGPAGSYESLALGDLQDGPAPEIWFGTFGLPKAAKAAAECMDGVLLVPNMTPEATAGAVSRIREACEQIDRDPESIRIAQCVVTAPELEELETRQIAHARAFTYLQAPIYGDSLCKLNGWDPSIVRELSEQEQIRGSDEIADMRFHRKDLVEPAKMIPEEWITESTAIGSLDECLAQLERFRAAGADELVTYGSTPGQNAKLAAAWAERSAVPG
jgi:5,10-methylenetetrahydromethanopterin reductase